MARSNLTSVPATVVRPCCRLPVALDEAAHTDRRGMRPTSVIHFSLLCALPIGALTIDAERLEVLEFAIPRVACAPPDLAVGRALLAGGTSAS